VTGKRDETTVKVTLKGVRVEQLPRLRTNIKTHLQHFARETEVNDGLKKPERKPKDAEQKVREVPVQGG
jgi:hypothetical protein